jgi:hypothetical protein
MNGPSPVRLAVASPSHLRRCEKGRPPRLLNPSGAFNDPFYPQIRVKNLFSEVRTGAALTDRILSGRIVTQRRCQD